MRNSFQQHYHDFKCDNTQPPRQDFDVPDLDVPIASTNEFSGWLERRLHELEDGYRHFWTQRSVLLALISQIQPDR